VTSSGPEGKQPRIGRKDFASKKAARRKLATTLMKKCREGFAYVTGAVASEAGALVYAPPAAGEPGKQRWR
jgi:hypothetical protein